MKYYKPKKLYLLKKGSELVKQEEEEIEELAEEEWMNGYKLIIFLYIYFYF